MITKVHADESRRSRIACRRLYQNVAKALACNRSKEEHERLHAQKDTSTFKICCLLGGFRCSTFVLPLLAARDLLLHESFLSSQSKGRGNRIFRRSSNGARILKEITRQQAMVNRNTMEE